jgi:hypothetical protein
MESQVCTFCKISLPFSFFTKDKKTKNGLRRWCKNCKRIDANNYNNTEKGCLTNLYGNMKKKFKSKRFINFPEEEKNKYICHVSKKEFFELFENHKKIFGYNCMLTGNPIFLKRTSNHKKTKSNNLSVDRLDPEMGYTKKNIIFVSSLINNKKGAVTKELCIAILKAYEERGL